MTQQLIGSPLQDTDLIGLGFSGKDVRQIHADLRLMLTTYTDHIDKGFVLSDGSQALLDAIEHVIENGVEAPTEEMLEEEGI